MLIVLAETTWPTAVMVVGVAFAIAFAWVGFFWTLSRGVPSQPPVQAPTWTYERGSTTSADDPPVRSDENTEDGDG